MALFRIQVFYQQGTGEKWSNVYHVDAADLFTAAASASGVLAPNLLPILQPAVNLVRVLTSDPTTPGVFIEDAIGLAGTSTFTGELLPFFNAAKVLFPILSGGRPDYKFIKGFITEAMQAGGLLVPDALTTLDAVFGTIISAMSTSGSNLVSDTLELWSVVTPQQAVQMRQMHRKRRRSA